MRRLLVLVLSFQTVSLSFGQTLQRSTFNPTKSDSSNSVTANDYYHLAHQYKNGNGVPMDYTQDFENFQKASDLGDTQSTYSVAYLQYKSLGCPQNHQLAAALFAKGASPAATTACIFTALLQERLRPG